MIEWKLVDAGVIAWAMMNGAICAAIIGLSVHLWRRRKRDKRQYVINAIARYDSKHGKRGAVKALVKGI